MVYKKQVHYDLKRLRQVKTWQLVIVLILVGFVAATFLRLNNIGMVERRSAVVSADEAGDDTVTRDRLYDLQRYVTSHMNTNMGDGVFLEASYNRAMANSSEIKYGNIYQKAQEVCAPKFSSYSSGYLQCTLAELANYPATDTIETPSVSAYVHNFSSPIWSPDFAGFTTLLCLIILLIIILRFIGVVILKILLKTRKKLI